MENIQEDEKTLNKIKEALKEELQKKLKNVTERVITLETIGGEIKMFNPNNEPDPEKKEKKLNQLAKMIMNGGCPDVMAKDKCILDFTNIMEIMDKIKKDSEEPKIKK